MNFDPFAPQPQRQRQQPPPPAPAPVPVRSAAPPPLAPLTKRQSSHLRSLGYTSGMIRAFPALSRSAPLRLFVLDNGSLQSVRDSHLISGTFEHMKEVEGATRWEEVVDCVAYHAQMASVCGLPTKFTLLNDPGPTAGRQTCSVGSGANPSETAEEMRVLKETVTRVRPAGPSDLATFINHCRDYISRMAPQLRANHQMVSVTLVTQGRPTIQPGQTQEQATAEFVAAIQSLANLPAWVVVRLTTDDEATFEFYNSLDATPGLNYDVLDDYFGEALEIYLRNPWLCYGLSLHRLREGGMQLEVLDEIDERPLNYAELRDLAVLLFGTGVPIPDPALDWRHFLHAVSGCMGREKGRWNPISRKVTPWFDLGLLDRMYGRGRVPLQSVPAAAPFPQTQPAAAYPGQQQQQQYGQQQRQQYQQRGTTEPPMGGQIPAQQQPGYCPQQQTYQAYPPAGGPTWQHARMPRGQQVPPMQQSAVQQPPVQQQRQWAGAPSGHQQSTPMHQGYPTQCPQQQGHPAQSPAPPPPASHPRQTQGPPPMSAAPGGAPPPGGSPPPMPAAGQKYASDYDTGSDAADTSALKRDILARWALVPPSCVNLRPIEELLSSVHEVLPPALGVEEHAYFAKWKPVTREALTGEGASKAVLKRAVRKMKFFLHPDKLPKDLTAKQSFLCRMLWDVVADADAAKR